MVEQQSDEELAKMKEAFKLFDKDDSGSVDVSELRGAMLAMGILITEDEVKEMIVAKDIDGDGKLDFQEFAKIAGEKAKSPEEVTEELKEAFAIFDKDKSGFIERDELMNIMTNLGAEKQTPEDVDSMIAEADLDNDGRISIEEFSKILSR